MQWARRGQRLWQSLHSSTVAAADASAVQVQSAAGISGIQWTPLLAARSYTNGSFWDVPQSARQVQELYLELHAIRTMLPHRNYNFTPHFSPHGVQLMPHDLQSTAAVDPLAAADEEVATQEPEMLADSVKRKRKLKMKKHKLKKRMKKLRHQMS